MLSDESQDSKHGNDASNPIFNQHYACMRLQIPEIPSLQRCSWALQQAWILVEKKAPALLHLFSTEGLIFYS